ncbi:MAG: hypothetical protein Q7J27_03465 [Syntrophales bacterium]|nr:hypothetical protein [Syntrophales bacterium]
MVIKDWITHEYGEEMHRPITYELQKKNIVTGKRKIRFHIRSAVGFRESTYNDN